MNIDHLLAKGELYPGADASLIQASLASLAFDLPADYLQFLAKHNGGEGFFGSSYLILWRVEELIKFNTAYEVAINAPGLFLVASSGGGTGYGFDTRDARMRVVAVEFIGMDWPDAEYVAGTFSAFIQQLAN